MVKVVIVGGGFAGLTALARLARRKGLDVALIDREAAFSFKPMLPDVIGRRVAPDALLYPLRPAAEAMGARFESTGADSIDVNNRRIITKGGCFDYDFALISAGARTTFYGREDLRTVSRKLDTVADAESIVRTLSDGDYKNAVIVGGGYTGVEAATNIRIWSRKNRRPLEIFLVEIAPTLLASVPEWMRFYCHRNMRSMGIEILTGVSVKSASDGAVRLSDGRELERALMVWTAGQQGACPDDGKLRRNFQQRLVVDEFMRAGDNCFAAGDAAGFVIDGRPIRLSVQFAITGGARAANNIIRRIDGRPLKPFIPRDPGFVIPMANNLGCGRVLGIDVKGALPVWLHYLLCAIRSYGANRRKVYKVFLRNAARAL